MSDATPPIQGIRIAPVTVSVPPPTGAIDPRAFTLALARARALHAEALGHAEEASAADAPRDDGPEDLQERIASLTYRLRIDAGS
ncbi:MAG TPA: hypothetical protein VFL93_13380 [Longimicrobiaceae bacterium]|nr:hypothetical protein [Longimicrobiaceae bacterium]